MDNNKRMLDICFNLIRFGEYNFRYFQNEHLFRMYLEDGVYVSFDTNDSNNVDYIESVYLGTLC